MEHNLSSLRSPVSLRRIADSRRIAVAEVLPVEMPLFEPEPWVREQDLRDALMTFALVFTGAMIFLF